MKYLKREEVTGLEDGLKPKMQIWSVTKYTHTKWWRCSNNTKTKNCFAWLAAGSHHSALTYSSQVRVNKDLKISGQIDEPGQKDKLIVFSLAHQSENQLSRVHSRQVYRKASSDPSHTHTSFGLTLASATKLLNSLLQVLNVDLSQKVLFTLQEPAAQMQLVCRMTATK